MSNSRNAETRAQEATSPATEAMNGADAVISTLADNGVAVCFANPGTSEMQLVDALDREPRIRPILCLFEGVASGAADGYGRMSGIPAATLLHLGPGLSNASANLHNARRAGSPIVNVVGDHATYHLENDAPLTSDIQSLARTNSIWVRAASTSDGASILAAEAVRASYGSPAGPATLILPADCAWLPASRRGQILARPGKPEIAGTQVEQIGQAIRAARHPLLLIAGSICGEKGLAVAGRLAAGGCRVMTETFLARQSRGAGRFVPERMPYYAEPAMDAVAGIDLMILVEAARPAAFFAYPGRPTILAPHDAAIEVLATRGENGVDALEQLAAILNAPADAMVTALSLPERPHGAVTPQTVGASIARHLPEHAIVSDDGVTSSMPVFVQTSAARPHDWLMLTGGAIGQGIPLSIGAAVACPERKVISLNGDGAALYTMQGLWTLAREALDVTVVIFANRRYRILEAELQRTGSPVTGPAASSLLDLGSPDIDWVSLARGFGVAGQRVTTAEEFDDLFAAAMARPGPHLIEVALAS
jgi:acetolactate synthase-1/2/3 large subunit